MPEETIEKPKAFRSLTASLIVAFLLVSSLVLLIAISLEGYFGFRAQQRLIIDEHRLIAHHAADTVKDFIQEKLNVLNATANFGTLSTSSKEVQNQTLSESLGLEPSFRQVILFDVQGVEIDRASRTSEAESMQISRRINTGEIISWLKTHENYLSPIYIYETTSEPMLVIAVSLKDPFGDFQGMLVAEANLKFMWDMVGGIKVGNKGVAYVVDREGKLIAFGDASRVLKGENLRDLSEVKEFMSREETIDLQAAKVARGINGTYSLNTHESLGTPDWAVIVEQPVEEAYQSIIQFFGFAGIILMVSIALAFFIGGFFSKRITMPIIHLRDAAVGVSQGKLETRIHVSSPDEIGQLADAFNQMASKLQELYGSLETKVRERTAQLEESKRKLEEVNQTMVGREITMIELKKKITQLEEEKEKQNE